jgi:hypothetical protein
MPIQFQQQLAAGKVGETLITRFLTSRGNLVLPIYEPTIVDDKKGPRLLIPSGELIAPDLLTIKNGQPCWIEAKHKNAFTWHRITSRWTTGIDRHCYDHYLQVAALSQFPVWLLFLHEGGQAKDSPANSPSGLFGRDLRILKQNINHTSKNWGRSGMVYWAESIFIKLASLEEVLRVNDKTTKPALRQREPSINTTAASQ